MSFQNLDTMQEMVDDILEDFLEYAKSGGSTVDAHLKLDDVKGSDTADGFKDQIPVLFMRDFTVTTGGGATTQAGKATPSDYFVIVPTDKSYPVIKQACAMGTAYKQADIAYRRAEKGEQKPYQTDTIKDVRVSLVYRTLFGAPSSPDVVVVAFQYAEGDWNHNIANTKAGYNYATTKKV